MHSSYSALGLAVSPPTQQSWLLGDQSQAENDTVALDTISNTVMGIADPGATAAPTAVSLTAIGATRQVIPSWLES